MVVPVATVGLTVAPVVSAASGATVVVTAATAKPLPLSVALARAWSVARVVIACRVAVPVAIAPAKA